MADQDYTKISPAYDSFMTRGDQPSVGAGIEGVGVSTQNENPDAPVRDGGSIKDMWIQNFIRSQHWKPKSSGFYLDGETGYAEFSKGFISGDFTVAGNLIIGGLSITIDNTKNIQTNLDLLNDSGGGTLYLKPGTYTQNTALTGYSNTGIVGQSSSNTIIDFNNTASNLSYVGTGVYTTGTITVASGVDITGSGTLWLANVSAGQHLFIGTRWYEIAAVTADTTLILAEAYGDTVTLPSTYRIASVIQNVNIKNVQLKNSTGTALSVTDGRKFFIFDAICLTNNKGFVYTNCSEMVMESFGSFTNTSNGCEFNNVGVSDGESVISSGNGGHGVVMNNVKSISVQPIDVIGNTLDGLNVTTGVNSVVFGGFSANGSNGVELVSGNDNFTIKDADIMSNTSDGIKLTASSDDCKIYACDIKLNGGYGINIAASTCDDTIILGNTVLENISGNFADSGVGTTVRGNTGIVDPFIGLGFGDSSDGYITFDGTTTILGLIPSSSVYTMTRDIQCISAIVDSGVTIKTAGYVIYATLSFKNNGTVHNNTATAGGAGGNTIGVGGTAGVGATGNTLGAGTAGSTGGAVPVDVSQQDGVDGTTGISDTAVGVVGVAGGNGGDVTGESTTGGAGGIAGTLTAENLRVSNPSFGDDSGNITGSTTGSTELDLSAVKNFLTGTTSGTAFGINSGSGGGGSGNHGTGTSGTYPGGGGGSGGAGGAVAIIARAIVNTGAIEANGAAGGAGGNASGYAGVNNGGGGGGGGGSGGIILFYYVTFVNSGTLSVAGGIGGVGGTGNGLHGGNTGQDGTTGPTGTTGLIFRVQAS